MAACDPACTRSCRLAAQFCLERLIRGEAVKCGLVESLTRWLEMLLGRRRLCLGAGVHGDGGG